MSAHIFQVWNTPHYNKSPGNSCKVLKHTRLSSEAPGEFVELRLSSQSPEFCKPWSLYVFILTIGIQVRWANSVALARLHALKDSHGFWSSAVLPELSSRCRGRLRGRCLDPTVNAAVWAKTIQCPAPPCIASSTPALQSWPPQQTFLPLRPRASVSLIMRHAQDFGFRPFPSFGIFQQVRLWRFKPRCPRFRTQRSLPIHQP